MHGGHSMKRQRGRGRKPGGGGGHHNHGGGGGGGHHNSPNRSLETNGPDTKFRGTASFIHERYLQLARDAASSGDRVLSENYQQHADHYFRLWRQMQPAAPPPQADRFGGESEYEGDDEGAPEAAEGGEDSEAVAADAGEQPDVEFPQGDQPRFERGEGEGRRRRGRRNRFRPGGGEGGEGGEGEERRSEGEARRPEGEARRERPEGEARRERPESEARRERPEGEGRRERQPRERDGEPAGPEGFSNGPRPAFLRGD